MNVITHINDKLFTFLQKKAQMYPKYLNSDAIISLFHFTVCSRLVFAFPTVFEHTFPLCVTDGHGFPLMKNVNTLAKHHGRFILDGKTDLADEMTENVINYGHRVDKSWM